MGAVHLVPLGSGSGSRKQINRERPLRMMTNVTLFTDGSCLGNPGPGGWASLVRRNGQETTLSGGAASTTNNRMELLAVIEGLATLGESCHVTVFTDSQYVRNAVTKRWLKKWQRNGWKSAAKTPIKNRDLWARLVPLLARHEVTMHWVRAHRGHPENERCDKLARQEATKRKRSRLASHTCGFFADVVSAH